MGSSLWVSLLGDLLLIQRSDTMTPYNNNLPLNWDFVLGIMQIIVAGAMVPYNLWLASITQNFLWVLGPTAALFYFALAPAYISKAFDPDQWTLSKWGYSIWSAIMRRIKA
jgi:hypothetical protein